MHPVLAQLYLESRQHDFEAAARRAQEARGMRRHHLPTFRLGIRSARRG